MPCYLFTYHGHGTWMPDHRRGYVHRQGGLQPPDAAMGQAYRRNQREPKAVFTPAIQSVLVEAARGAGDFLTAKVHAVATEPTHVHVLVSWRHERTWKSMRTSLRSAMTRALNARFSKRTWFADSPSRKRVRDRAHLDHLLLEYLVQHGGVTWLNASDVARARQRRGLSTSTSSV